MADIQLEWQDDYNLGVENLDNAHKELFQVIYKFQEVLDNKKNPDYRRAICISMIRYLVKYVNQHLAIEESYMEKNGYVGFEVHKHLHDNLRLNTLPYLIKMVEEQNYSDEAITKFIAMACGWFTGHILVEDRAITGNIISRWNHQKYKGNIISQIDEEFRLFAEDLFSIKVHIINRHYEGEYIGDSIYKFYNTFKGPKHSYVTLFLCEEKFVKYCVDRMTHHLCEEISAVALDSFEEIVQSWSKAALNIVDDIEDFEITDTKINNDLNYDNFFDEPHPLQSLLWKAEDNIIGICIKEVPN